MTRLFIVLIYLAACCAISVWSVPVEPEQVENVIPENIVPDQAQMVAETEGNSDDLQTPSKEDSSKFFPNMLPPFLMGVKPSPGAFGNASSHGDVGALFAENSNSLFVESGPNSQAVAQLSSNASYFATPINHTQVIMSPDGSETESLNLAGFTVTAQEDTQAYAEGDFIQFINHGASYATGWGDSTANGTTYNESPPPPPPQGGTSGGGSGWKAPAKGQSKPSKPRVDIEKKAALI